jgi:hypothetical protein
MDVCYKVSMDVQVYVFVLCFEKKKIQSFFHIGRCEETGYIVAHFYLLLVNLLLNRKEISGYVSFSLGPPTKLY